MEQNRDPRLKKKHVYKVNYFLTRVPRILNGKRIVSSISDDEKTAHLHARK